MLKDWFSLIFLDKEIKEDVLFLKKIDVFKNFTTWQLKKITTILYRRTYLKNEFIYKKGEPAKMVCFLKSGKIKYVPGAHPLTWAEASLDKASDSFMENLKRLENLKINI